MLTDWEASGKKFQIFHDSTVLQLTEEIEHKEKKTKSDIEIWPKIIGVMLENLGAIQQFNRPFPSCSKFFIFMQLKLIFKKVLHLL